MSDEVTEKRCTGCGEVKGREEFSKRRRVKDGLQSRCKGCARRYREENREAVLERDRRRYEENREAVLESQRRYREENREAIRERDRRYHEENREAIRESRRRYREENREAIRERDRRYQKENLEVFRASSHRRRARKRSATVEPFTSAELHAAWDEAAAYTCYLCDLPFTNEDDMQIEHVVPLARGGAHTVSNLAPAHASCNYRKGTRPAWEVWEEIMTERGYDVDELLSVFVA